MRQEVGDRKVYWHPGGPGGDYLLYDFNMGLGPYPLTYNNGGSVITAIDSVLLVDGYHKRWVLDTPNANDSTFVIEGVGSSFGLMNHMGVGIESGTWLNCFARNDSLIFQSAQAAGSPCDMYVDIAAAAPSTIATPVILPNPGTDHFTLALAPGPHSITLVDATGRIVMQQRISNERETFSTAHLPSGIYVLHIDKVPRPLRWMKE